MADDEQPRDEWDFPDEEDEVAPDGEEVPAIVGRGDDFHSSRDGHPETAHTTAPTWAELGEGWQVGVYRDPILCGVFAGAVLGLLGVFIVLRRAVFVTAAMTQAAGLGVALAFFLGIHHGVGVPPVVGAFLLSLAAAASVLIPTDRLRLPREAALGFTFVVASAAAVLVGDRIAQEAHDIAAILFGTAVVVSQADLLAVSLVGAAVLAITLLVRRGLVFAGFDAEGARVQRLPAASLDLLLWFLVALEVSVSTRAIGSLPVFAFAVLPAMTALALVNRMRWALVIASLLGALAGGVGYVLAFFGEFPVGASQTVLAALFFVLAWPLSRLRRA